MTDSFIRANTRTVRERMPVFSTMNASAFSDTKFGLRHGRTQCASAAAINVGITLNEPAHADPK